MADNIANRNGMDSFAFAGPRSGIWHRKGQQALADWTLDEWLQNSGLDYEAVLLPAHAIMPDGRRVNHGYLNTHSETGHVFGHVSQVYKNVQPREAAEWFMRYIRHDSRFTLSAMGALGSGQRIWATAEFADFTVGREAHKAYLLMTTTFDGSGATSNRATFIRGVCQNTVSAAMLDKSAVINTRHSTTFDGDKVARELETVVKSVEGYKTMGDAMANTTMRRETVAKYFKRLLDIPFDAKSEDVSARKLAAFSDLGESYRTTVAEGAPVETAWAALNAVTRYVDHDRNTRANGGSVESARLLSANFGSGAEMKADAIRLLTTEFAPGRELVPVLA